MLMLLGCGVVANNLLPKNKGKGSGFLFVNLGWGLAVFSGVLVSGASGAHLNPAVTLGLLSAGKAEFATGVAANVPNMFLYFGAQMVGGFLGAVLAYASYKKQFDEEAEPALKLAVFSTAPEVRSYGWNIVTEVIGTFVLVFVILGAGHYAPKDAVSMPWLGALGVALLVVVIGTSLGGPTGYAINPARDLAPRIAHAVLPIPGKRDSDWSYSWVPVVGPLLGGAIAGLCSGVLLV